MAVLLSDCAEDSGNAISQKMEGRRPMRSPIGLEFFSEVHEEERGLCAVRDL